MKLYNSRVSPYASRVRIAIYAKNLPVEIVSPPGGQGSAESEIIHEYLEDRFPTPSLRPADPHSRARMRTLSRFADLNLAQTLKAGGR